MSETKEIQVKLAQAFYDLPEVPSIEVLKLLSDSAYSVSDISVVVAEGKALQKHHGLDAVPPVSELEWAAGLWSLIRRSIIEERIKQAQDS